jgi:adenine/guanine phosphoribosyltransferase-like PRPP-binding protein
MTKTAQQQFKPIGDSQSGYGWTGMGPAVFAERMKLASTCFVKLKKQLKFDAIAFCGSSGSAAAFSLAMKHKIPLIYVRKKNEKSHSYSQVECNAINLQIKKYLIVDDFVDSGATLDYIVSTIRKFSKKNNAYPAEQVGVLCYDPYQDRDMPISTDNNSFNLFTCDQIIVD